MKKGIKTKKSSPTPPKCSCSLHLLSLFSIVTWVIGCAVIGYMAWVLASSVSVSKFISGNLLFTYVVVGVGFTLFVTGFLGCIGTSSRSSCLIKLYTFVAVLCIATQAGGILTFIIMKLQMSDVLVNGWKEVNQVTRNIVQKELNCCGYDGPKEFAYRSDLIDSSCYSDPSDRTAGPPAIASPSNGTTTNETVVVFENTPRFHLGSILKQDGCGEKLQNWMEENRIIWQSILASLGGLQILSVVVSVYVISDFSQRRKSRKILKKEADMQNHAYAAA